MHIRTQCTQASTNTHTHISYTLVTLAISCCLSSFVSTIYLLLSPTPLPRSFPFVGATPSCPVSLRSAPVLCGCLGPLGVCLSLSLSLTLCLAYTVCVSLALSQSQSFPVIECVSFAPFQAAFFFLHLSTRHSHCSHVSTFVSLCLTFSFSHIMSLSHFVSFSL